MFTLITTFQSFIADRFESRNDRGATAVEYGLLVALIAVAIISAIFFFGDELKNLFNGVTTQLENPSGNATDDPRTK